MPPLSDEKGPVNKSGVQVWLPKGWKSFNKIVKAAMGPHLEHLEHTQPMAWAVVQVRHAR